MRIEEIQYRTVLLFVARRLVKRNRRCRCRRHHRYAYAKCQMTRMNINDIIACIKFDNGLFVWVERERLHTCVDDYVYPAPHTQTHTHAPLEMYFGSIQTF